MSKTQAETVIKNIIREIVQECTTRGQIVSETLVAFTVLNKKTFSFSIENYLFNEFFKIIILFYFLFE